MGSAKSDLSRTIIIRLLVLGRAAIIEAVDDGVTTVGARPPRRASASPRARRQRPVCGLPLLPAARGAARGASQMASTACAPKSSPTIARSSELVHVALRHPCWKDPPAPPAPPAPRRARAGRRRGAAGWVRRRRCRRRRRRPSRARGGRPPGRAAGRGATPAAAPGGGGEAAGAAAAVSPPLLGDGGEGHGGGGGGGARRTGRAAAARRTSGRRRAARRAAPPTRRARRLDGHGRRLLPGSLCSSASARAMVPSEGERPPSRTCGGTSPSHESAGDAARRERRRRGHVRDGRMLARSAAYAANGVVEGGADARPAFWPPRMVAGLRVGREGVGCCWSFGGPSRGCYSQTASAPARPARRPSARAREAATPPPVRYERL